LSVKDLNLLYDELPEVFEKNALPDNWEEDYVFVPIDLPEEKLPPEIELEYGSSKNNQLFVADQGFKGLDFGKVFPGSPVSVWPDIYYPPPDALAFYLPFHFYFPVWWGIYLNIEGTISLAQTLYEKCNGKLNFKESLLASQIYLYGHETYHHNVESFAVKLEIAHRIPLYKKGFNEIYLHSKEDTFCGEPLPFDEEALADAYAYNKALSVFKKDKSKQSVIGLALKEYIANFPPCYNEAPRIFKQRNFKKAQCDFAEMNFTFSLNIEAKDPNIWMNFPNAFLGIARITSRVKYIIHKDSPLIRRKLLNIRFLRYAELKKKLEKIAKCFEVRHEGGHIIWENPFGNRFPVPRHPGDLRKGTLAKIIKQAGLNLSYMKFISEKV
jgi:predicted RNA binding protein YcfA (HicA-like mRNA interferase family)